MVWNMLFLPEQLPEIGTSIPVTPRLSPFVMIWSVLYLLRSSFRSGESFFYFFRIVSIERSFIVRILSSAGTCSALCVLEFEPTLFWLFRSAVLFIPIKPTPTLLLCSGKLLIRMLMPDVAVFR